MTKSPHDEGIVLSAMGHRLTAENWGNSLLFEERKSSNLIAKGNKMATETLTQEDIIAKLTAERDAYKLEATGGKDLNALKKAEKDFASFDIRIIESVTKVLGISLEQEDRTKLKAHFVSERYAKEVSKTKANDWA